MFPDFLRKQTRFHAKAVRTLRTQSPITPLRHPKRRARQFPSLEKEGAGVVDLRRSFVFMNILALFRRIKVEKSRVESQRVTNRRHPTRPLDLALQPLDSPTPRLFVFIDIPGSFVQFWNRLINTLGSFLPKLRPAASSACSHSAPKARAAADNRQLGARHLTRIGYYNREDDVNRNQLKARPVGPERAKRPADGGQKEGS